MIRSIYGRAGLALAALSLAFSPAMAANISVKDGAGTTQTMCTGVQTDSSQAYCFVYHDSTGAQVDLATKAQATLLTAANGNPTDPYSVATDGTSASEVALLKGTIFELKAITGQLPAALGATTQAQALGVALSTDGPIGQKADAPATTTDTTPTSLIAQTKQMVSRVNALIALMGAAPAQVGGKVDTVIQGTSANRSAVIGFTSTASSATSASTSLPVTVNSTFTNQAGTVSGIPMVGQIVAGSGITAGTTITAVSGSAGAYTLTLSAAATVASGAAVTSGGPQQVMALNASRRGFSQQNQSTVTTAAGNCGVNGLGSATLDANSLIIAGSSYYETKDSHTGTGAIADLCGTPATPVYIREW